MGSSGEVATTTEIVVLVLHFLKKNGFDGSYERLIKEAREKLHLKEPQEDVRDLQDILNEYLLLLDRSNTTHALVKSDRVGKRIRAKVTQTFENIGRLMEDYLAAREYLSKKDSINDKANTMIDEDMEDSEEDDLEGERGDMQSSRVLQSPPSLTFDNKSDLDTVSPISARRYTSKRTGSRVNRKKRGELEEDYSSTGAHFQSKKRTATVSSAYPGNKKVTGGANFENRATAAMKREPGRSGQNSTDKQTKQQHGQMIHSHSHALPLHQQAHTTQHHHQAHPQHMHHPHQQQQQQLQPPPPTQMVSQRSSLSEAVGTMSEQLKKRQGSSSNQGFSGSIDPHQRELAMEPEKFATPRKFPSNELDSLALTNMSFTGSVAPIDLDVNLSRSRLIALDDQEIGLGDIGTTSQPFNFEFDGNKTNKSLLFPPCSEVSLGSILDGPGSFLGNPCTESNIDLPGPRRTAFGSLLMEKKSTPSSGISAPSQNTGNHETPSYASSTLNGPSMHHMKLGSSADSVKTMTPGSERKKKRRITPTPIRAKSTSTHRKASPISQSAASGKISDVDSFLTSVHGP